MLICTVKPVAVLVVPPNAGFRAAPTTDVSVTIVEPLSCPALVVVIVAVELVPAATLYTVTKPELLIDTKPDAVAVPAHV